jgi:Spy/CpxP family protein refolding chaperone
MSVGHVVLIAALTFVALGAVRRVFWFARWRRMGGHGRWRGRGRGHRRGFGVGWISRAIDATPEQEVKLAEIVDKLRGDMDVLRQTRSGMITSLVELLPGETLDEAALGNLASKANVAYEKIRGDLVQALAELHRTLTPAQRRQVTVWVERRHSRWA